MDIEVVTPDAIVYSGKATFLSGRDKDGSFGILPNHAPAVIALDIAPMRIDRPDEPPCYIAVFGGFMEVCDNKVDIITPNCEHPDQIDVGRATRAKERAEQRLAANAPDIDIERARLALARALLRLHVVEICK